MNKAEAANPSDEPRSQPARYPLGVRRKGLAESPGEVPHFSPHHAMHPVESTTGQASGGLVSNVNGYDQNYEATRRAVAHCLYERMAMISAAIWMLGTLVLFIIYAAGNPRPIPAAGMAMTLPLIPAALPWLFYRPLTTYLTKRRTRSQCAAEREVRDTLPTSER